MKNRGLPKNNPLFLKENRMSFYFPIPEVERKSKNVYDCDKCKLKTKNLKTPEFRVTIGNAYDGLVILGQIPSKDDDTRGIPFINEEAGIIRSTALKNGINLAKQAAILFALSCHTKKATETQFKCCRNKLKSNIEELKPKLIICCGEMAFKYLFNLKNKYAISKLRNRIIPNYEFNCLVYPIFSPEQLYFPGGGNKYDLINAVKLDLERIFNFWKSRFHKRSEIKAILDKRRILKNITITEITSLQEAQDIFAVISQMQNISFDYETTNASPYDNDFEMIYFAFGNATNAWVFHEDLWIGLPKNWGIIKHNLIEILENPKILKIIQNSKFEDLASRWVLKIKCIDNVFCTMIATHVVDERGGCTSQDFQNLVRFGIPPYNEAIKKYIVPDKDQKVNRIREAPKGEMIQYNGLDVITCYHNWLVLDKVLLNDPGYPKARECYEFLLQGHKLFANLTQRGVNIGQQEFDELEEFINAEMEKCITGISNLDKVIEYNKYLESKIVSTDVKEKNLKIIAKSGKRKFLFSNDNK